ncbi:hypothetical protein BJP34_31150 [Moorena producens PAL-8-15-08-1]|uniref:DNA methyltransferase n=1 Tax=Moorena producens PAL-8-15-08-1 TaxID=1458985 RepID=A0A1D8U0D9_9CYAN|nr:hypothetical protein [Moorena producens]AOX03305.1 hypothetical protein BJP34_31150 [Moorena producens PAL-8-15-08-1]
MSRSDSEMAKSPTADFSIAVRVVCYVFGLLLWCWGDRITATIEFIAGDGFEVCEQNYDRNDAIYFIDPPYLKAGRRLYRYSAVDHEAVFKLASQLEGDFLMSYENTEEIRDLASGYEFAVQPIAMKNTHHAEKTELLIGRNLDWFLG